MLKNCNDEEFKEKWLDSSFSVSGLAQIFGTSERYVYYRANSLGLPKIDRSHFRVGGKKVWDREKIEQLRKEYPNTSTAVLARKYGVSSSRIRQIARDADITRLSQDTFQIDNGIGDLPTYAELINLSIDEQKVLDKMLKQPEVMRIKINEEKPIGLVFTADWHLGHYGVDYAGFDRMIGLLVETDGLYVYPGGDGTENFINMMNGKGIGAGLNQQQVVRQRALFIRAMEKIRRKVVAWGSSTEHTGWTRIMTGIDDLADIAKRLNLIYTDVGGLLELTVGDQLYNIFRTHQYKFHSAFNLCHAAKQLWRMGKYDADIVVVEHRHVGAIEKFVGHGLERIAIRTGSFKIYDDYARKFGYYGISVANPTVILFPGERRMIEFLHIEDAVLTLRTLRNESKD